MRFSELGLNEALLRRCESQDFTTPTPIQEKAIPLILGGKDLIGCAETGTGKTAAFILPLLKKMMSSPRPGIKLLVIAPTRELATQIEKAYESFAPRKMRSVNLIGGANINKQTKRLKSGVSAVIATPGRFLDHYERGNLDLRNIEYLVLDEADRMLDMGFLPSIRKILALLPEKRQNLLFSATMSDSVKSLSYTFLHDPEVVEVSPENKPAGTIEELAFPVAANSKTALLLNLLEEQNFERVIVFTRTKRGADRLAHILKARELSAKTLHSDRSQSQRERALNDFKNGKTRVLVATDIASRGIDVDSVSHVINYDVPKAPEDYVHRVGRTGRAGKLGQAITLVTPIDELAMRDIEYLTKQKVERIVHPEFGRKPIR
ncbi:MAG: ATP-dependent helicase [Acidobacteria bacterium]|nr:MAG: ATP-dependent helicase [Acidobacteriota bacterium]REJ98207.1 MAG: ATP-dependent helicase [Acidobacteriota bacterium]REK16951.1 MAG: ATP-dependent helicase [Acidobacteriota bacterium]REK42861.1 MAG: ATP-dependent helicase [Acidobacteriota bacterium]